MSSEVQNQENLRTELLKLQKKLSNERGNEFVTELVALSDRGDFAQLEFKLNEYAKHRQAILSTRANDEELRAAKEQASNLGGVYSEQLRCNDRLSRFIALLLQTNDSYEGMK